MSRRMVMSGLVAAVLVVLSGCLSDTDRSEAQALALGDDRLTEILRDYPYVVTDVRRPIGGSRTDAVVEIEFHSPVPRDLWTMDTCDIAGTDGPITGVRWLVDLQAEEISAATPLWSATSCLPV